LRLHYCVRYVVEKRSASYGRCGRNVYHIRIYHELGQLRFNDACAAVDFERIRLLSAHASHVTFVTWLAWMLGGGLANTVSRAEVAQQASFGRRRDAVGALRSTFVRSPTPRTGRWHEAASRSRATPRDSRPKMAMAAASAAARGAAPLVLVRRRLVVYAGDRSSG